MHRAVGPLTIGTYIPITTLNDQDHVPKVERSGSGYAMASTKNKNDPNVEWYLSESLGNDRFRVCSKISGTSFKPSSYVEGALLDREAEPVVYIIRETETKGEYTVSEVAENESWYIHPVDYGCGHKISKEPCRWSCFKVEN